MKPLILEISVHSRCSVKHTIKHKKRRNCARKKSVSMSSSNLSLQLRADGSQKANAAGGRHIGTERQSRQRRHRPRRLAESSTQHFFRSLSETKARLFLKSIRFASINLIEMPTKKEVEGFSRKLQTREAVYESELKQTI